MARHLFEANSAALFYGWDGQSMLSFLAEQRQFSNRLFSFGSDPIIGLGNMAYPVNPKWFPSYIISFLGTGAFPDRPLAFAIAATELFAATMLAGRCNGFPLAHSTAAAWLLTLISWPLFGFEKIVTLWCFFPHHAEVLVVTTLLVAVILLIGCGAIVTSVVLTGVAFIALTIVLFSAPTSLVLVLGVAGPVAISAFVTASGRVQRATLLSGAIAIGAAAVALGYAHFIAGLFSYTAASEFPQLSVRYQTPWNGEISLLIWTPPTFSSLAGFLTPERSFVGAGLLGSILMALSRDSPVRRLGMAVAGTELTFIAIGVSNYFFQYWIGPTIWYFELFLFPYFALAAVYLVAWPALLLWRQIQQIRSLAGHCRRVAAAANVVASFVIPLGSGLHAASLVEQVRVRNATDSPFAFSSPFPQPETEITQILRSEIGLTPGARFRGRVAVMTGRIFPEERDWQRYSLVHYFAQLGVGNLHDGPGLWQSNIPTLFEYNTLLSPPYFVFVRSFFTEPDDFEMRNLVGTRRVDERALAAIGVRFILSDMPIEGAVLRAVLPVPISPQARKGLGFPTLDRTRFDLYLYELSIVNLGQFSPTEVSVEPSANDVMTRLTRESFSFATHAILDGPVPAKLAPGSLESLSVERGGLHARASSTGTALLLIPFEFSRCLGVTAAPGTAPPRLFRTDLLLTGVLFDRNLDAEISFNAGPVIGSRCRLQDAEDMAHLAIKEAFKDRPALGVLRKQ